MQPKVHRESFLTKFASMLCSLEGDQSMGSIKIVV